MSQYKMLWHMLDEHIAYLKKELKETEKLIDKIVQDSKSWKEKEDILCSVPGIGKVVARSLLAELPELGSLSNKAIAAMAGVAPVNKESGKMRGHAAISGGRATVRKNLYMSALVATRFNPIFKSFYEDMVKRGKKKKIALVAVMRKLLVCLNAMIIDKKSWNYA